MRRRSTMLQRCMANQRVNPEAMSDPDLLTEVRRLAGAERQATASLIAALAELDVRRLYLGQGCSSLFTYCTQVLHLSEHAAYGRIEAARAARKWPVLLALLADGSLHLTAVTQLGRHLTDDNHQDVLRSARHKSKREIEELVARLHPQPAAPSFVRKLPSSSITAAKDAISSAGSDCRTIVPAARNDASAHPNRAEVPASAAPKSALVTPTADRRAETRPLAQDRYKIQFTASRETYEKLREAQDLLRHQIPSDDLPAIVDRALSLLLAELRKMKYAAAARPRPRAGSSATGRHIPAAVKRDVWQRDGGQCAFVGGAGRCTERGFLEYHHVIPFADGGATDAQNLQLRCRAHNAYEAQRWCGVGEEELVRESRVSYHGVLEANSLPPLVASSARRPFCRHSLFLCVRAPAR